MKKKADIRRKYDETADIYDRRYYEIQMTKYRETFSEFTVNEDWIIYDIGGGTGLITEFFETHQNIICGDLSFEMLKKAKKRGKNTYLICMDSENIPLKRNSGDLVTCFSVIQNVPNPKLCTREFHEILKSERYCIITALQKIFSQENLENLLKMFTIEKTKILSLEDIMILGKKEKLADI